MAFKPIKHKYRAKRTEIDSFRFDSKLEARYYQKLKRAEEAGDLIFFLRQAPFHLPGNIRYVIDFIEFWENGDVVFTDVKGIDTPVSKTKRKQVESLFPIQINVVNKV